MLTQSLRMTTKATKTAVAMLTTLLLACSPVSLAQQPAPTLNQPINLEKTYARTTPRATLERQHAFARSSAAATAAAEPQAEAPESGRERRRARPEISLQSRMERSWQPATVIETQSFGTGGGDISEIEPNGTIAQNVVLPVNIFGESSTDGDVDFFAFQGLAGQSVVIEPFAARLAGSELVADIALFTAAGQLLTRAIGSATNDPLIRFTPTTDAVLIVGVTDVDGFGGRNFDYLLNVTRGGDLNEREPNSQTAQAIEFLPVTIFGDIEARSDVDFYSFAAEAGQTLIVDIDAEVLGSRLDAVINLSDAQSGKEFFFNDQSEGDDPRLNIVLPHTGRYVVGVGSFDRNSRGFYRLNLSLVAKTGAPTIMGITPVAKKLFDVVGFDFTDGAVVEVNGVPRKTTVVAPGVLRGKAKLRAGDVVTVTNAPDRRRSNPLVVQ